MKKRKVTSCGEAAFMALILTLSTALFATAQAGAAETPLSHSTDGPHWRAHYFPGTR